MGSNKMSFSERRQAGFDPTPDLEPPSTKCVPGSRSGSVTGAHEKCEASGPPGGL